MAKQSEIDKLLEQLEQSEMLEKLLLKLKKVLLGGNEQSYFNHNAQTVNHTIENIFKGGKLKPDIQISDVADLQKLQHENEKLHQQLEQLKQNHQHEIANLREKFSKVEYSLIQEANLFKQGNSDLTKQVVDLTANAKQTQEQLIQQLDKLKQDKELEVDLFGKKERHFKQEIDKLKQENINLNTRLQSLIWVKSFEKEYTFLQQVQSYTQLAEILLPHGGDNVLQLITTAAQWNNILRIWEVLANQVKNTQQTISESEQKILEHSINLYNFTLLNSKAELRVPQIDARYDYTIHHQVSGSGRYISQVLLPALYSADEKIKSALVITE